MKKFLSAIVTSFFLISDSMAMDLLCSNRDFSNFIEEFNPLEEAEKLFPKFVYLNNDFVQWGWASNDWSESIKIQRNAQNSWEISEVGAHYTLRFDPQSKVLNVILYRINANTILPHVNYKNCEFENEEDPMGGLLD